MPGAVPNTSTLALSNATTPFILKLAKMGWKAACIDDPHLLNGLNAHDGQITNIAVSKAQGLDYCDPKTLLDL